MADLLAFLWLLGAALIVVCAALYDWRLGGVALGVVLMWRART